MYTEERKMVCDLLRKFGVTSKYKGYLIVVEATMMYVENQNEYLMITKDVYPVLAKRFKGSVETIEQNIRSVIAMCWNNNERLFHAIANYPLPKKPSNSEFLDILAYYVSKENH